MSQELENDIHGFYLFEKVLVKDPRTRKEVICKITFIGWAGFEEDTFYWVEILEGSFKGDIIKGFSYNQLIPIKD